MIDPRNVRVSLRLGWKPNPPIQGTYRMHVPMSLKLQASESMLATDENIILSLTNEKKKSDHKLEDS